MPSTIATTATKSTSKVHTNHHRGLRVPFFSAHSGITAMPNRQHTTHPNHPLLIFSDPPVGDQTGRPNGKTNLQSPCRGFGGVPRASSSTLGHRANCEGNRPAPHSSRAKPAILTRRNNRSIETALTGHNSHLPSASGREAWDVEMHCEQTHTDTLADTHADTQRHTPGTLQFLLSD